jgi:hypothetical protein
MTFHLLHLPLQILFRSLYYSQEQNTIIAITTMIPLTDGNAQIQRKLNLRLGQKADPEL